MVKKKCKKVELNKLEKGTIKSLKVKAMGNLIEVDDELLTTVCKAISN